MDTRAEDLFEAQLCRIHKQTSHIFAWLMGAQWVFAIVTSLVVSPRTWSGAHATAHPHVFAAIVLGAGLTLVPIAMVRLQPEAASSLYVVAIAQTLWSALLIHLTGGRIETHFHVFVSLAFLAFYRDWRLIATATAVVTTDHLARGLLWPESLYGVANPEWWRFLEHATWLLFEDVVLILGIRRSIDEMKVLAQRTAGAERVNVDLAARAAELEVKALEISATNEALEAEMARRQRAEVELRQAQKLESVGRLAAGVAHEINTPVQFVTDSVYFLRDASRDVDAVVDKLRRVRDLVLCLPNAPAPLLEAAEAAQAAEAEADLAYLAIAIPEAHERSLDGLGRVAGIVKSMKEFAHPDSREMQAADLNRAIETTLVMAKNEYKYVADVETHLGELPPVMCHVGDVNQTLLNLVVNASHAIGDLVKDTGARGRIVVSSSVEGADAVIRVEDTGCGIPEAIHSHIFDPFFTTKEVGRGTGQGLAIARSIIVDKHGGSLTFETELGRGTTFEIRLPLASRVARVSQAA